MLSAGESFGYHRPAPEMPHDAMRSRKSLRPYNENIQLLCKICTENC